MGKVSNLIKIIIKAAVNNTSEGELSKDLINTLVDGVSDKGLNEINDFINGSKYKIASILSEENMKSMNIPEEHMGYVVNEIKNLLSNIDITDEIIRKCNYNPAKLEGFLLDGYYKSKDYIENENYIKTVLYSVADVLIGVERESEDFASNVLIQISNTVDDTNAAVHRVSKYMEENFRRSDASAKDSKDVIVQVEKFQNNKKQDYIDNWNSRLFLHIDNEERPITLAEAFITPYCKHIKNNGGNKFCDKDTIDTVDTVIEKYVKYGKSANLLIIGVPGIGKTSIVSWLTHKFEFKNNIIVLRFRDWERKELDHGILSAICNTLKCEKRDLENRIIILDGYDEMKALDNGEMLINNFLNETLDFENIKLLITSRKSYIEKYLFENVIELLPFEFDEIKDFYQIITGNKLENILNYNNHSNYDVLGIPVILYMAIMSDIDITKDVTKPELYRKIFAEKGGIFDKFSYGGLGYDYGNQPLRDIHNIKIYLEFLQEVAFKMFDADTLSIPREEDKIPKLTFQGTRISVLEFPIKNLFESTISKIEFVHKSIYEYFVSEFIIQKINNAINLNNFKEELAAYFGKTLVNARLSIEIIDFLKYRIKEGDLIDTYDKMVEVFQLMLQDGMTYYTGVCYRNVIECESKIFANMFDIMHLWVNQRMKLDETVVDYLKYNKKQNLNLSRMDLSRMDLIRVELEEANLREAD